MEGKAVEIVLNPLDGRGGGGRRAAGLGLAGEKDDDNNDDDGQQGITTTATTATIEDLARDERAVGFIMTVYGLSSLDTGSGVFGGDIGLHMFWFEPQVKECLDLLSQQQQGSRPPPRHRLHECSLPDDVMTSSPDGVGDRLLPGRLAPGAVRIPVLFIENSLALTSVNQQLLSIRPNDPAGIVRWEHRLRGTFEWSTIDLHYFPFDIQSLHFELRINSKYDNVARRRRAVLLTSKNSTGNQLKPSVHLPEWHLYTPKPRATKDAKGKPQFMFEIPIRRRHEYFSNYVIVIMGTLCSLGIAAFAVEIGDFETRSSIVLTLLLTTVAFKFATSDQLPKVPYSTVYDNYSSTGIFFLASIFVEMALARWHGGADAHDYDSQFAHGASSLWGLYNAVYLVAIALYIQRTKWALGQEVNTQALAEGRRHVPGNLIQMLPRWPQF